MISTVPMVWSGENSAGPPTRRMSRKGSRRSGPLTCKRTLAPGARSSKNSSVALSTEVTTWPRPTPTMPSRGAGPQPKHKAPPTTTCSAAPVIITPDGPIILPDPLSTEAKILLSHSAVAAVKTIPAYCAASRSVSPRPPSR